MRIIARSRTEQENRGSVSHSTCARFEPGLPVRLTGHDRLIESPVPVPGTLAAPSPHKNEADLSIRMLSVRPQPVVEPPIYRFDGGSLLFSAPATAEFRCRSDEITITPYAGADVDQVTGLLLATALPASLWMAGGFVLHASAVRLPGDDRAIAIAGPSGAGKSTLAAALVGRGAALVADDTVRIAYVDGTLRASGLPGGWFAAPTRGAARRFCPAPDGRSLRNCSLGAVVVLSCEAHDGVPVRVDPIAAVELLLANRHRPRIPAFLGRRPDSLRFCGFLAQSVPLYILPPTKLRATALEALMNELPY